MSSPSILEITSARSTSAVRNSATTRPPRSTVMRSLTSKTCSRKCETNSTATPWSHRRRTTPSSRAASSASRLDVGSSSTSTRGSSTIARATATSCLVAGDSADRGPRGSMSSSPSVASAADARALVRPQSMPSRPRTSWPIITFSATVRCGLRCVSWKTVAMPSARLCATLVGGLSTPSTTTVPARIGSVPVSAPMRVDLPAPFSPMSACTSPGRSARSTPSSTRTPESSTVIPRSSTTGVGTLGGEAISPPSSARRSTPARPSPRRSSSPPGSPGPRSPRAGRRRRRRRARGSSAAPSSAGG